MGVDLREDLYKVNLNYVKKEPYTGSFGDLRFKLVKYAPSEDEDPVLRLWLWPGPLCFDKTDDEKKRFEEYPFSKEGLEEAVDQLMELQKEGA